MMRSFRGQFRRVPALLTALVLLVSMMIPMQAAQAAPFTGNSSSGFDLVEALTTLRDYGLVKGDNTGDLRLSDPISRAEMVTILVRALGYEQQALFLASATPFPDLKGHWAAGYVMVAKNLNMVGGYPDGTFRPDQPVSYAEALALLLRLVKREPTGGGWPDGVLTQAVMEGIAPPNVALFQKANDPATRLDVFSSFYLSLTAVKDRVTGKTLLATLDAEPPVLALSAVPTETEQASVTISGQVTGARKVTVAGKPVTVDARNSFSATVELKLGTNTVEVQAVDAAGNVASQTLSIERIPPIARLEITGPTEVDAGTTATYTVKAYNAAGAAVALQGVKATVSGGIGSFDVATGKLTAAAATSTGTITVSAGGVSASISVRVVAPSDKVVGMRFASSLTLESGTTETVIVEMIDDEGNRVTGDNGRKVTLTASGIDGVVINPSTAETVNGRATFQVMAGTSGSTMLTAASAGLDAITQVAEFVTPIRIELVATPTTVTPGTNETSLISARLVDKRGNLVANNTGSDIVIRLAVTGAGGTVSPSSIRIRSGQTTSAGYNAVYSPGLTEGTARIVGTLDSDGDYSITGTAVTVQYPLIGSAYEIKVLGPGPTTLGNEGLFILQVVDRNGNTVTDGSFAFRVKVETSNNETKTNGIPDGVNIWVGNNPATDPVNDTYRTRNGIALVRVTYDKSGVVTLTPVGQNASTDIPDGDGTLGTASRSTHLKMSSGTMLNQGTPAQLELKVTSPVSSEASTVGGSLKKGTSQSATLSVRVLDAAGYWIPGYNAKTLTLNRTGSGVTNLPSSTSKKPTDGKLEFVVSAGDTVGTDYFTVEADFATSDQVQVQVVDSKPNTPTISSIAGNPSGTLNEVAPNDEYMEIRLAAQADLVAIKVYRGSSLIYTSPVLDLASTDRIVYVPRSKVSNGTYQYRVVAVNAYGSSDYSDYSENVTAAQWITSTYINSAKYDASTQSLIITGSGFGADATYDGDKVKVYAADGTNFDLGSATFTRDSSTQLTVTGGNVTTFEDSATYSGTVVVKTEDGWYKDNTNGNMAKADTSGNQVKPAGHISKAEIDLTGKKLYLNGRGFNTGTIDKTQVKLVDGLEEVSLDSLTWSKSSDTLYTITLTVAVVADIQSKLNAGTVLRTADGWLTDGTAKNVAQSDITLVGRITVSSVTYDKSTDTLTINGSGFTGVTENLSLMYLTDLSEADEGNANVPLALTGGTFTLVSDARITVQLADAGIFENTANFNGNDIYFYADEGWLTTGQGFPAAAVPTETYRIPQP